MASQFADGEGGVTRRFFQPRARRSLVWALTMAIAFVTGAVAWRWAAPEPRGPGKVIVASTLLAGHETGRSQSGGFDRIRIPTDATDLQLSIVVPPASPLERLAAEIVAIDDGRIATPTAAIVAASARGATVNITAPAPRDGDYVLRLRRAGGDRELVLTTAFRVVRVAADDPVPAR